MKERPILFSAPMVRAILDGTKTQTRRVVKLPEIDPLYRARPIKTIDQNAAGEWGAYTDQLHRLVVVTCPYGKPGDRLWVRETFRAVEQSAFQHDEIGECEAEYRASPETHLEWCGPQPRWQPSIHMPRWASRITLEVTDVRAARLWDISESDAKAEGADCADFSGFTDGEIALLDYPCKDRSTPYINGYSLLWESINGNGSWDANPWVWVVEFERMEQAA